jgi:heme-degrading monooxygenase HmoA
VKLQGLKTLTGWESHDAMKAFSTSGNHLEAMKRARSMGNVRSVSWEAQSEPDWQEAIDKLKAVEL